ncbi:MAG: hypothetical protein HYR95_01340 [Candidatus Colwellbacteria bacterium]|nr:hypothetical protein [Candidatus Colwellbacteria bacterium]
MKKLLGELFKSKKNIRNKRDSDGNGRKILEKRVEEGTNRAIKEYREVFNKLAEYDKA